MRTQLGKMAVLGTILALSFGPALAQGRGNGGGVGAGMGGGANVRSGPMAGPSVGGNSGLNGQFGGQSDAHITAQERTNSNGPNAPDRDFGADRAADRTASVNGNASGSASARAKAASELGSLNAAHASETARANAASGSTVGEIGTYETRMKAALAISNPTQRNAAITKARQDLALNSNKTLTASAIAKLDNTLNIQGASPQLGAAQ